jgi:alpha-tubulin suppressor-like RCC1 family protein
VQGKSVAQTLIMGMGANTVWQLGIKEAKFYPTPQRTKISRHGGSIVQIAASASLTLTLSEHGKVFAFGKWNQDESGQPRSSSEATSASLMWRKPLMAHYEITKIFCSKTGENIFAVTALGELVVMGDNKCGQLGLGHAQPVINPTINSSFMGRSDQRVVQVSCYGNHALLCCGDMTTFSAGANESGQLGLGHNANATLFTAISALKRHNVVKVATGEFHSLFLCNDGQTFSCGSNEHGQLGIMSPKARLEEESGGQNHLVENIPCLIEVQFGWSRHQHEPFLCNHISAGAKHSLAIGKDDQLVYAWGDNSQGQLGLPFVSARRSSAQAAGINRGGGAEGEEDDMDMISSRHDRSVSTVSSVASPQGMASAVQDSDSTDLEVASRDFSPVLGAGTVSFPHPTLVVRLSVATGHQDDASKKVAYKMVDCGAFFSVAVSDEGCAYFFGSLAAQHKQPGIPLPVAGRFANGEAPVQFIAAGESHVLMGGSNADSQNIDDELISKLRLEAADGAVGSGELNTIGRWHAAHSIIAHLRTYVGDLLPFHEDHHPRGSTSPLKSNRQSDERETMGPSDDATGGAGGAPEEKPFGIDLRPQTFGILLAILRQVAYTCNGFKDGSSTAVPSAAGELISYNCGLIAHNALELLRLHFEYIKYYKIDPVIIFVERVVDPDAKRAPHPLPIPLQNDPNILEHLREILQGILSAESPFSDDLRHDAAQVVCSGFPVLFPTNLDQAEHLVLLLSHGKSSEPSKKHKGRGVIWMPSLVEMLLDTYLGDLSRAEFWVQLFQQTPWRSSFAQEESFGPDDSKFRQRTAILIRSIVKLVQEGAAVGTSTTTHALGWDVMFQMQSAMFAEVHAADLDGEPDSDGDGAPHGRKVTMEESPTGNVNGTAGRSKGVKVLTKSNSSEMTKTVKTAAGEKVVAGGIWGLICVFVKEVLDVTEQYIESLLRDLTEQTDQKIDTIHVLRNSYFRHTLQPLALAILAIPPQKLPSRFAAVLLPPLALLLKQLDTLCERCMDVIPKDVMACGTFGLSSNLDLSSPSKLRSGFWLIEFSRTFAELAGRLATVQVIGPPLSSIEGRAIFALQNILFEGGLERTSRSVAAVAVGKGRRRSSSRGILGAFGVGDSPSKEGGGDGFNGGASSLFWDIAEETRDGEALLKFVRRKGTKKPIWNAVFRGENKVSMLHSWCSSPICFTRLSPFIRCTTIATLCIRHPTRFTHPSFMLCIHHFIRFAPRSLPRKRRNGFCLPFC